MANKPLIVFDTSALNSLADESDSTALISGMTAGFVVALTGDNVDEIAATPAAGRRHELLSVCKRLLSSGFCLKPHDLLLETLIIDFSSTGRYNWRSACVRFPNYEDEVARKENMTDDLAKKQADYLRRREKEFATLLNSHRPEFDRLYQGGHAARPQATAEFLTRLKVKGGAFWSLGMSLYERVASDRREERAIREFITHCPPFHAMLLAICLAQYERCVRDLSRGKSLRAGKFDLYMSVYLPYCDEFVTGEARKRQLYALQEVASLGKLGVQVRSYQDFRASLLYG